MSRRESYLMGWQPYGVSSHNTPRWRNDATGRVAYQDEKPGDGHTPGPAAGHHAAAEQADGAARLSQLKQATRRDIEDAADGVAGAAANLDPARLKWAAKVTADKMPKGDVLQRLRPDYGAAAAEAAFWRDVAGHLPAGDHAAPFDGRDPSGYCLLAADDPRLADPAHAAVLRAADRPLLTGLLKGHVVVEDFGAVGDAPTLDDPDAVGVLFRAVEAPPLIATDDTPPSARNAGDVAGGGPDPHEKWDANRHPTYKRISRDWYVMAPGSRSGAEFDPGTNGYQFVAAKDAPPLTRLPAAYWRGYRAGQVDDDGDAEARADSRERRAKGRDGRGKLAAAREEYAAARAGQVAAQNAAQVQAGILSRDRRLRNKATDAAATLAEPEHATAAPEYARLAAAVAALAAVTPGHKTFDPLHDPDDLGRVRLDDTAYDDRGDHARGIRADARRMAAIAKKLPKIAAATEAARGHAAAYHAAVERPLAAAVAAAKAARDADPGNDGLAHVSDLLRMMAADLPVARAKAARAGASS